MEHIFDTIIYITYQVESAAAGLGGGRVDTLDPQHEHAVAPARPLVGQGLRPGSVLPRLLDDGLNLVLVENLFFLEVGHVDIAALGIAHLDLVLEVGVSVQ